jgi:hypothetical protein
MNCEEGKLKFRFTLFFLVVSESGDYHEPLGFSP